MSPAIVVFGKEIRDGTRDRRSIFSAAIFCWLGPLLVGTLWRFPTALALLPGFVIIAGFTGAMNIANDITAGERERGSLEPLLLNPVSFAQLLLGKFLAVCVFGVGSILLTLVCALGALEMTPLRERMSPAALLWMLAVSLPLAPLAAGADLLICTFARTAKEGNSYLSMALLAPMLIGILAEFFPVRLRSGIAALPLLGQERMLSAITRGQNPDLIWLMLSWLTSGAISVAAVVATARLLRNERVLFGR